MDSEKKQRMKEYMRKYYEEKKDIMKEKAKLRWEDKKDEIKEYRKEFFEKYPEKKEKAKSTRTPEQAREYMRAYNKKKRELLNSA
jgi:hypothetical protein